MAARQTVTRKRTITRTRTRARKPTIRRPSNAAGGKKRCPTCGKFM